MTDPDWRDARSHAAAVHAEALARRTEAETREARRMIAAFIAEAGRRGIAPVPVRARSYDGRHRYRTAVRGWYLRRNETVALGDDGAFYLLSVAPSLGSALRGARPEPSDPPIILGKGARDGESIDLVDALRIVLGDPGWIP